MSGSNIHFHLSYSGRTVSSSNTATSSKDRVSSVKDSRIGGTVSPSSSNRRVVPLPPKPGTPSYETRQDAVSATSSRDQREANSRDAPPINPARAEATPELLVIPLKGGPSTRESQEPPKEPAKDYKRETVKDTGRESTRDQSRDSREHYRDSPRELVKESPRDRMRDLLESTDRDLRASKLASAQQGESRDRRDSRDPASRKDLRESAPRDPRDRGDGREQTRVDGRDGRESREGRDDRDARDVRDGRESRDSRESRESRENRDGRDSRDTRESRDARDGRDIRESRDGREGRRDQADLRDSRVLRDGRESRESRIIFAPKDPREVAREESADTRESRDGTSRGEIQKDSASDSRASQVEISAVAAGSSVSSDDKTQDRETDRQRDGDRHRDDDRRARGRESDRGRDKDLAGDDKAGERDRRPQGRERVRDDPREQDRTEAQSSSSGRDRPRADIPRDQDRPSTDRRGHLRDHDELVQGGRSKSSLKRNDERRDRDGKETPPTVSSSRERAARSSPRDQEYSREDTQPREDGREDIRNLLTRTGSSSGSSRPEGASRDRDSRGTSRRQDTLEEGMAGRVFGKWSYYRTFNVDEDVYDPSYALVPRSSRESSSRSGRPDSTDRKRGRESRDTSADREKESKRRREGSSLVVRIARGRHFHL